MNHRRFTAWGLMLSPVVVWALAACSASSDQGSALGSGASSSSSGGSSSGGSEGDSGGTSSSASGGTSSTGTAGSTVVVIPDGGAGSPGDGPEVCDGVDNDANGITDDVDVGMDGVCDCLNIATIGQVGPWGTDTGGTGTGIFSTWLNSRSPLGAVHLDDQVLTAELLAPFQVIVVLHVSPDAAVNYNDQTTAAGHHLFSAEESQVFKEWVEAGGGVMTTIGYLVNGAGDSGPERDNVNALLSGLGIQYSDGYVTGFIEQWTDHPIADGVSNIQTINGVLPDDTTGTAAAMDNHGNSALQAFELGEGRAAMWGDEWITYDSLWADVEDQQVELLWLNTLKWLSPAKECQVPIPPTIK